MNATIRLLEVAANSNIIPQLREAIEPYKETPEASRWRVYSTLLYELGPFTLLTKKAVEVLLDNVDFRMLSNILFNNTKQAIKLFQEQTDTPESLLESFVADLPFFNDNVMTLVLTLLVNAMEANNEKLEENERDMDL